MLEEIIVELKSKKSSSSDIFDESIELVKTYFKAFFQKYPSHNFGEIKKISFYDVMTSMIYLSNPYSISKAQEVMEKYKDLFSNPKNAEVIKAIALLSDDEAFRMEVMASLNKPVVGKLELFGLGFKRLKPVTIYTFLELLNKYPEFLYEVTDSCKILLDSLLVALRFYKTIMDLSEKYIYYNEKEINRMFRSRLTTSSEEKYFVDYLEYLNRAYRGIIKDYNASCKRETTRNSEIDLLVSLLSSSKEITDIDTILSLAPIKLREKIVDYILAHNLRIHEALENDLNSLERKVRQNYEVLFGKYGYDYNKATSSEKEYIENLDYEVVENILKRLDNLKIVLSGEMFVKIASDKLNTIEKLIADKYLTKRFVCKYPCIVLGDNNILERIVANIELLEFYEIKIYNYPDDLDILFSNDIQNNLNILMQYGLKIDKATTHIDFLKDLDLADKIDMVIEMGRYEELTCLDILNLSLAEINRQRVLERLNIDVNSNIKPVVDSDLLVQIGNLMLKDEIPCLYNGQNQEIGLPNILIPYKVNPYVLLIGDVYVSINRLQRNLAKFLGTTNLDIFYAIIYNSYYSASEINSLENCLFSYDKINSETRS